MGTVTLPLRRPLMLLLSAATATAALGCKDETHEKRKAKRTECNAFIDRMNKASADLAQHTGKASEDEITEGEPNEEVAAKRRKLADAYAKIAQDVADSKIQNETLKTHADQYGKMCRELSEKANTIAGHIAKGEGTKAQAVQEDFNKLVKRENTKLAEINGFCARL